MATRFDAIVIGTGQSGPSLAERLAKTGKRVAVIGVQAPFALPNKEHLENVLKPRGGEVVSHVIYEKDKPTYRSEIDQIMKAKPDFIYTNGYAPDTVVLLRDLYKANINLAKFCQSYAVPQKTLDSIPPEVWAGTYTGQPSADIEAKAFTLTAARLGIAEPDSYEAQATDWASLVILTLAKAKEATLSRIARGGRRSSRRLMDLRFPRPSRAIRAVRFRSRSPSIAERTPAGSAWARRIRRNQTRH